MANNPSQTAHRLDLLWASVVAHIYMDAIKTAAPDQAADSAVKMGDHAEGEAERRLGSVRGSGQQRLDYVWAFVAAAEYHEQWKTSGPMLQGAKIVERADQAVEYVSPLAPADRLGSRVCSRQVRRA